MEKVSQPVRIFALVAALAAVGGALFLFTQGGGGNVESALVPVPVSSPKAAPSATSKPKAHAPAPKPAARPKTPRSGFPFAVDAALRKHEVVVVSLIVPGARVDELAAAEARAGAKAGGVGFLALNVLNEQVARALLTKLDGLEDPTLLVLKRPGVVAVQLGGFVDRDLVAQAAANAAS